MMRAWTRMAAVWKQELTFEPSEKKLTDRLHVVTVEGKESWHF